jgi:predicted amidohydrolase YtcJ
MTVRTELLLRTESVKEAQKFSKYYRSGFGDNSLKIGGLKLRVDGGVEGAYLKEPYRVVPGLQDDPEYKGCIMLVKAGEKEFKKILYFAAKKGWKVVVHIVGDAAIDYFIDLCDEVNEEIPVGNLRWSLHHIFLPTQNSIQKMKGMKLIAAIQNHPTFLGLNQIKLWGYNRARYSIPLRMLLDNNIIIGGGTDAPVVPYNPFISLWWMVTRKTITAGPEPLGPEQSITIEEALRLYTFNSAYCMNWEDQIGSIETGKLADLAVLDVDLLTCPKDEIKNIKVLMTIVGGKIVYRSSEIK